MVDEPEFEELEHIPWAALAARRTPQPAHVGLAIVGLAVVVAVLVVVVKTVGGSSGTGAIIPESPVIAAAPLVPQQELIPEPVPVATTLGTETYSEADLMLIDVEEETRLAIAHAEWVVRDYMTADGDPLVAARMAALLPETPETVGDTLSSYVEWVDTYAVSSPVPGTYLVEVLYRRLTDDGEGFVRLPAAAILVELAIDVDGSAELLSLTEEIQVPLIRRGAETAS